MIRRGELHWVDLGPPRGSRPAKRRPVLVVSDDRYNQSRLGTFLAVVVTSNTDIADLPGNVYLPAASTGLPKDSVANVTGILTIDKSEVGESVGSVPAGRMAEVDAGLRLVMGL